MKFSKVKLIALLLSSIFFARVQAQDATLTTGGNATGDGGSVSYSIGQVVFTGDESQTGTVFQGVQLPFEISIVVGFEVKDVNLEFTAYPNPTTNNLILKVKNFQDGSYSYRLYNDSGTLIKVEKITRNETTVDMATLTPAIYYLKIIDSTNEVKTFKILKR